MATPEHKLKKAAKGRRQPRAYIKYWRSYPDKSMIHPNDPEQKHIFLYDLELPGTSKTTHTTYLQKGFKPIEIFIDSTKIKKTPQHWEHILVTLQELCKVNVIEYKKACDSKFVKDDETLAEEKAEKERRAEANKALEREAKRQRNLAKEQGKPGATLGEVHGAA